MTNTTGVKQENTIVAIIVEIWYFPDGVSNVESARPTKRELYPNRPDRAKPLSNPSVKATKVPKTRPISP